MVWREFLLTAALVITGPFLPMLASGCGSGDKKVTGCINDGGVDVFGSVGIPGWGGGGGAGGSGSDDDAPPIIWKCIDVCEHDEPAARPVTLTDIAHFRPTPGVQHMQPDGWTVPGLDTNFYAVTWVHIVEGELLGESADVRFTPVAYHWNYGDGSAATRHTKGATWKSLGVHEFDRTPTSHIYKKEARYTIRLVIDFRAEYRFAGSAFVPIAGVLPVPANDLHITVDGAKTVLVERDCTTDPVGPGC